eukprot:2259117-Rhodomonas_salina.1
MHPPLRDSTPPDPSSPDSIVTPRPASFPEPVLPIRVVTLTVGALPSSRYRMRSNTTPRSSYATSPYTSSTAGATIS